MEVNVREGKKIVEVWLGREESADGLGALCTRWRERGYLAAVYRSGGEDLAELTAGLLLHNERALAERSP